MLTKIEETKPLNQDDMIGTIMTMVETNLQSSLSSSSATAMSRYTDKMEEQKHMISDHLSENSKQMATLCNTITTSDRRHDTVFTEAKQIAQEMKEGHDKLAELIHATTGSAIQMMETYNSSQSTEHTLTEQPTPHGKGEVDSLWPSSAGARSTWPLNMDHAAIRTRAMGVLNLMESFPHTPPTWLDNTVNNIPEPPQQAEEIKINSRESICAKCKKQDIGLLFCDRCPEEVLTLYHPTCLTLVKRTSNRICDHCWEASQESTGTPGTTPATSSDEVIATSSLKGADDTTQPTLTEVLTNPATTESSDSSRGSSSESDYNPKYRSGPKGRQTSRDAPPSKTKHKQIDTSKISPPLTRARRAVKKAREDAFDTSDEGETE